MLRIIICFLLLSYSSLTTSQSISYSLGYGLSNSEVFDQFDYFERYNRGPELSLSLGLNGTNKIADQIEIRLSTYESTLQNSITNSNIIDEGINLSIRKYLLEVQGYYFNLSLKKFGGINFGSKFSYIIRSDVSGFRYDNIMATVSEINSINYERPSKFYFSILGKYSIGSIKLKEGLKLKPSYTFSYSFNKDVNTTATNSRLKSHIFELAFISDMGLRKRP
jgi:hypothetical protein